MEAQQEQLHTAPTLPMPLSPAEAWWARAICRTGGGELADAFFSEELTEIAKAKRICATCPVMGPCLRGAIDRHEPWGVWGGQMIVNGKIVATKRRRGRPPKTPRPEDFIPDIPLPEGFAVEAPVLQPA